MILFIGDGMGFEQVKAAGLYLNGVEGTLLFEGLPHKGEVTTHSANNSITDSAAAGTAMATGVKVNNDVVSVAIPGDGSDLETVLEYLRDRGKMTGLVTTAYITHATPAVFGAHQTSRTKYAQIALDYLERSRPNVLFGGASYIQAADEYGYTEVFNRAELYALDTDAVQYVSGQFGSGYMPYEYYKEGDPDPYAVLPHLSEMTAVALDILDNDPDGFFLMVEGARIDHAGHSNLLKECIHETIEFDNAVGVALAWAQGRDDTLIIVTSDHETGGLKVTANNGQGEYPTVTWSSTDHTAANVPVYAWGPGAEKVAGVIDNTDFFQIYVAPVVELVSPPGKSTVADTPVAMTCRAYDDLGIDSAELFLGTGSEAVLTFTGPGDVLDVQIDADNPNAKLEGAASIKVDGLSPHAHALMVFPSLIGSGPGQVPPGSTIASAILQVNCFNQGHMMTMHRLLEDWTCADATWNQRHAGVAWGSAGADGWPSIDPNDGINADCTATGWRSLDLTRFVQEWADGAPNYGIVFRDGGSDGVEFYSAESGSPPVLTVTVGPSWEKLDEITDISAGGKVAEATVMFAALTLDDAAAYAWNVRVTNLMGEQAWAVAGFEFRVDSATAHPALPAVVSPASDADNVDLSPVLSVTVSDPDSAALDVVFFGRGAGLPGGFEVIVLPETKGYTRYDATPGYPEIFTAQTQWTVDNATARNIAFLTHAGDIVQNYDQIEQEWIHADTSLSILDGTVPYGLGIGNRDMPTTLFNQYFPFTRYEANAWYGGHYPSDKNDNSFQLITAGGEDWLFLHVMHNPAPDVLAWADGVLKAHPRRRAVITTHSYLYANGTRTAPGTNVWNALVVPNDNVGLVLCGHEAGEARRVDYVGRRVVHQVLADYQFHDNGGDGWMRIMGFVPARGQVFVETFSPTRNGGAGEYGTQPASQFSLGIPANEFAVIGTVTVDVSSGPAAAAIVWPGLATFKGYAWFARVTDPDGNSQVSPVWRFTTGSDDTTPPVISGVAAVDITDHAATITWITDEPASSRVDYGVSDAYGAHVSEAGLVFEHAITLSDLSAGTEYHYMVSSADAAGNASSSMDFTFVTLPDQPPAAPLNLSATPGDGVVFLEWDDNSEPDLAGYHVYRVEASGGHYEEPIATTGAGTSAYADVDVVNGVTYYYVVTAFDAGDNESAASLEISATPVDMTPPAVPAGLVAAAGESVVLLEWDDNSEPDLAGYNVYRAATSGGPYGEPIAATSAGTSAYADVDVINGVTYYYVVTAFDASGNESAASLEASATPVDLTPPSAPSGLVATAGDGMVSLAWDDNVEPDLSGYNVYRAEESGGPYGEPIAITSAGTSAYADADVVNGVTYYYVVSAFDLSGNESAVSLEASATPVDVTPPAAPTGLAATAGDGMVSLAWDDNAEPDLAGYNVYRAATSGGPYGEPIATTSAGTSTYADADVVNGVTYYYVVTAFDLSANESACSAEAFATPLDTLYDAYAAAEPNVPLGVIGGSYEGTLVAGDGMVQTISEAPAGNAGMSGLEAIYTLHTTASPVENITTLVLHLKAAWTGADGSADPLIVWVWNLSAQAWDSAAVAGILESESVDLSAAPGDYVDASGNILVRFTDTAAIRRETKDTLTIDLLYAHVSVAAPNASPTAVDDHFDAVEDVMLIVEAPGVLANDTDPEGDPLTAVLVAAPTHGALVLNADGSFEYLPDEDFHGTDVFTYRASDGWSLSNEATVTITVAPVNDAPVAVDDAYGTVQGETLVVAAPGVLENDYDVDGDGLTAILLSAPENGVLALNADGAFTYTPDAGFLGADTFTYAANDGTCDSAPATVTITVSLENSVPVAADDAYETLQGALLTVAAPGVLANDTDADGDPLTALLVGDVQHGALVLNADGSFTYTPAGGFWGTDAFTYKASDGMAESNTATVTITVTKVNSAPVAADDAYSAQENTPLTVTAPGVLANDTDADGDPLTAVLVGDVQHGALVLNADGSFTYTPADGFTGTDAFTYKASDGMAESNTATVTITVTDASQTISVADIAMSLVPAGRNTKGEARVTVSPAIADATVTGDWFLNGAVLVQNTSGQTDGNGVAVISSVPVKVSSGDTFTFVVTSIAATGYDYAPQNNVMTEGEIIVP